MRVVAIIQARMGSSRLPGKVLKQLADRSVLGHVITRLSHSAKIDEIVIATTNCEQDYIITEEAGRYGVPFYRGDEQDVLSRYYHAAKQHQADVIIRVTSDCPLIDPDVCDDVFMAFLEHEADYASNVLERSYPRGLDTEVFHMQGLTEAYEQANSGFQKEHVTPYFYQNPDRFKLHSCRCQADLSHFRWTLDTVEDWTLIQAIYNHLYEPGRCFSWTDVLQLMQRSPELQEMNAHIIQKQS